MKNRMLKAIPREADEKPASNKKATKTKIPPSREGKKPVTGYFHPGVMKALKMEAIENDTTVQALVGEALELLFAKKHIKTPIEIE